MRGGVEVDDVLTQARVPYEQGGESVESQLYRAVLLSRLLPDMCKELAWLSTWTFYNTPFSTSFKINELINELK